MAAMKEYPRGSGKKYPTYDADYKLELTLVEADRCSGIRNDYQRCAISTTLRTKLGAVAVETGKTILYVLWRPTFGPHRGEMIWERWEIPPATRKGIEKFDAQGTPVPADVYFLPVRASDRALRGRRRERSAQWPSRRPEARKIEREKRKREGLQVSRSMSGQVHLADD